MSLFDFARELGRKVFDHDGEAAAKIKEHIEFSISGIEGLDVKFDDGVATLCGECDKPSTRDMAVLIAGNVQGVEKVVADDLRAPAPPPEAKEPEPEINYYVIQSGDTLSAIAKHFYGNAMEYMKIFEANKGVIDDPNKIYPGQKIRIP